MRACTALRNNGQACRAPALPSGERCFAHDSANRERAQAARRKGGLHSSNLQRVSKRVPRGLQDLQVRLLEAIDACERGELSPRVLTAMASAAGAVVRIHEVAELGPEVEALRDALEARGARWPA